MASKVMDEHEKCRRKICIICKNKGDRSLIPSEIAITIAVANAINDSMKIGITNDS